MYLLYVSGSLLSDCPEDGGNKLLLNVGVSVRIYASTLFDISAVSDLQFHYYENLDYQISTYRWRD